MESLSEGESLEASPPPGVETISKEEKAAAWIEWKVLLLKEKKRMTTETKETIELEIAPT